MAAPNDVQHYLDRITPEHADKPKFMAMIEGVAQPFADAQAVLASIPELYDLDSAVGVQLDRVGKRVGRSRDIAVPITNVWFSFSDPLRGFSQGIWRGPYSDRTSINSLDDDIYRKLLRAKIMANRWDGSVEGAQAALDAFFDDPETRVFVVDRSADLSPIAYFGFSQGASGGFGRGLWKGPADPNLDPNRPSMAMTVCVAGKIPPLVFLFLLAQDLIAIKPEGVSVQYAVTSVNKAPIFGFGVQNDFISGFGTGSWAVAPDYFVNNTAG
jgi:hypothetical protein